MIGQAWWGRRPRLQRVSRLAFAETFALDRHSIFCLEHLSPPFTSPLRHRSALVRNLPAPWQLAGRPGVSAGIHDLRAGVPRHGSPARRLSLRACLSSAARDCHPGTLFHVHLLLTPRTDVSATLRRLKGYSARQANRCLRQTGRPFWQDESYDRRVRSAEEFRRIESYILSNPLRAGLVQSIESYPWSGAGPAET